MYSSCPYGSYPDSVSLRSCVNKYGAGKTRVVRRCSTVVHPNVVALHRRLAEDGEVRHRAAQDQVRTIARTEFPIAAAYLEASARWRRQTGLYLDLRRADIAYHQVSRRCQSR